MYMSYIAHSGITVFGNVTFDEIISAMRKIYTVAKILCIDIHVLCNSKSENGLL